MAFLKHKANAQQHNIFQYSGMCGRFYPKFFPPGIFSIFCSGLFPFFAVLDCVDGNMARTMNAKGIVRKNAFMGSWVDAVGGYCAYTFLLLSIGISASFSSNVLSDYVIIISAVSASMNMLMRAVVQSYKITCGTDTKTAVGKSKRFSEEIGITGWLPVLYLAGYAADYLHYVASAYALIYCGGCLVTVLKLIIKVERQR